MYIRIYIYISIYTYMYFNFPSRADHPPMIFMGKSTVSGYPLVI
jgi:hypothetical protein